MFIDARELDDGTEIDCDVCILGAGAAGITLARELADSGYDVGLFESGGLDFSPDAQSLYQGMVSGLPYAPLEATRLRFFGGTTNHWGGVCVPLEEDDFEERDWVPNSGWPFRLNALLPFYERAHSICGLTVPFVYAASELRDESPDYAPFDLDPSTVRSLLRHVSPIGPARFFGQRYRESLQDAENVRVYFNANALELVSNEAGRQLESVSLGCLTGTRFSAKARLFVMAMGGIENARLLLLSTGTHPNGLGNDNDLVGRYFADHYYFASFAYLFVNDPATPTLLYEGRDLEGNTREAGLALTPSVRRRERLLNVRFQFRRTSWDSFQGYRVARSAAAGVAAGQLGEETARRIYTVLRDLSGLSMGLYGGLTDNRIFAVGAWTEHIPNESSRVRLTGDTDAFGQRRVELDWRMHPYERESLLRSLDIVGAELARDGTGRMFQLTDDDDAWPTDDFGPWGGGPGLHHMGTTRMHEDPTRGVVDANCALHDVDNFYIAGNSVFPTFGQANPTLTIVALTLRLAEHLKARLSE